MKAKILLTVLSSFLLSTATYSQIGVKAGFALGERVNTGQGLYYGFDLGLTYDITESLRGEVLFEGLFKQENLFVFGNVNYKINYRILPITAGIDYRFLKGKVQPFAGLNLGVVSLSTNTNGGSYYAKSHFALYPKAGVDIEITKNILVDLTLKYLVVFNNNNLNNNTNTQVFGANIGLIYVFN
ncbi:MAG TPA: outer membrane beta-barrel protein [Brumimicrobium sp.]|nr:outer membrane beta-barrel protein [Brumimicrobium sp.]